MPEINYWLLFLLFWILIYFFVWGKSFSLFICPVFWMGMGFLLNAGLYFSSGYDFFYKLRPSGLLYIIAIWVSYSLSFILNICKKAVSQSNGAENERSSMTPDNSIDIEQKDLLKQANVFLNQNLCIILFCFNLIGFLLFFVDFIRFNSFGISSELHTESVNSKMGVIGIIFCFLGIVIWLYNVHYAITNDMRIKTYAFLSLLFFLAPNAVIAGRQAFLLIIVSTLVVIKISLHEKQQYKYSKEYFLLFIIFIFLILSFSTLIAMKRSGVDNKIALLQYCMNCEIPEKTQSQLIQTGPFQYFFLEVLSYYSHELPTFQTLYDNWDYGLLLGGSQFQFISRKLSIDSKYSFDYMWLCLDDLHEYLGNYSHTWRTIAGNCIIDYGRIGGLFYMFICGLLSRFVYSKAINSFVVKDVLLLALVDAGAFFCLQYSPFCELSWFSPLIWILVIIPVLGSVFKSFNDQISC